jgi:tetratricopeptide (TPR) repeat protein
VAGDLLKGWEPEVEEWKEWFDRGNELLELGRFEDAISSFDRVIQLEPKDYETWCNRGFALGNLGRDDEAIYSYKQATKIKPNDDATWLYLSYFLKGIGRYAEALDSLDRLIELKPDCHLNWNTRGIVLDNLGRYEDALNSYDRSIQLESQDFQAWFNRSFSLHNLGRHEEVVTSSDRVLELQPDCYQAYDRKGFALAELGRYEEALLNFDLVVQIQPFYYYGWYYRGMVLVQLNRYKEAITNLNRAIEIDAGDDRAWFKKGMVLGELGRYEEAISCLDRSIEIQPDDLETWFVRGVTLRGIDRNEEAVASFERVTEINPNFYEAWCERGIALLNLGRNEDAITSFNRVIEIKPDFHEAYFGKGLALKLIGKYKEAIANYDRAIAIKPDYYEAWSNRGSALEAISKYKEAIASYNRAIEINPDFHLVWYNRGMSLEHLGKYNEAIPNFERAIQLKADDYQSLFRLGVALDNLGWYKEAFAVLKLAIEVKPDFSDIWCSLGVVLENLGQYKEAIASYEQSIKLKPDDLYQVWANRGVAYGKLKGYQSQINAYYQAFQDIEYDTHPNHWGFLYRDIGRRHYLEGKSDRENSENYYNLAIESYHQVLKMPACKEFPKLWLDITIDISKVHLAKEDVDTALDYHNKAFDIFRDLLNDRPTFEAKKYLQLEYYELRRFDVAYFIVKNDFIRALEVAELDKNNCLTWMLSSLEEDTISPKYAEMRQLINRSSKATEQTGIIYWHYSSDNLTTFILTAADPQPLAWKSHTATPTKQLKEWIEEWDKQYRNYGSKKDEVGKEDRSHHPWRKNLPDALARLRQILEIDKICAQLPATLTHLILIPHSDLHRFPLHTFFLTSAKLPNLQGCTYLPSIQIGLNLQKRSAPTRSYTPLLSVEDPETYQAAMPFARIESAIVRSLFQPHTHIDSASASLEAIENALRQPHASFHFTGHAAYNSRAPEASALALTDEPLTAKRISQLDLSSYNLITLAACETAITGREKIDTEYVGLTSAFLQAGAANILSTLWQVDEIANAWFTIYFYQQLLAGKPPAVALNITQRWLQTVTWQALAGWLTQFTAIETIEDYVKEIFKEEGKIGLDRSTKYSHPYYWAAFTLTGQG